MDYLNMLKKNDINIINKYKDEKNDKWAVALNNLTRSKKENIINQFTSKIIKQIFKNQQGLDFFTKIPMIPSKIVRFPFKPSLDRLDNSKPHTPDNCVLVCYAGNAGRSDATVEQYQEHINLLRNKKNEITI